MKRTIRKLVLRGRVYLEYADDYPDWPKMLEDKMREMITEKGYFIRSGPVTRYFFDKGWESYSYRVKARAFFVGKKKVKEMIAKGVKIEKATHEDSLKNLKKWRG